MMTTWIGGGMAALGRGRLETGAWGVAVGLALALTPGAARSADIRDHASPESWAWGMNQAGDTFVAHAEAFEVSPALDSAVISLECGMGFDVPEVRVW